MRVVAVELGTLLRADRVLQREVVKVELLGDRREILHRRLAVVQPDAHGRVRELVLDELQDRFEGDVVAERVAAGWKLLLPVQAEVAAVDDGRQLDADAVFRAQQAGARQADAA